MKIFLVTRISANKSFILFLFFFWPYIVIFFICKRDSNMFSRNLDFCVFGESTNFKISDVIRPYCTSEATLPADIFLFKVNYRNTKKGIFSKSTRKRLRHWRRSGVFLVNFEYISHFSQCFYCLLWTKCVSGFRVFFRILPNQRTQSLLLILRMSRFHEL